MADTSDILGMLLEGRQTPSSASGSWDEPVVAPPKPGWDIKAYLKSLPAETLERWRREGERIARNPDKISEAPVLGPATKSYHDIKEGQWLPAIGHGLQAVGDVVGGSRASKIAKGGVAATEYLADLAALPAKQLQQQLINRALVTKSIEAGVPMMRDATRQYKVGGDAWKRAVARDVEKRFPAPTAEPPAAFASEAAAQKLPVADVVAHHQAMNNPTTLGQGLAAMLLGSAPLAGTVLDDVKGATIDPLNTMRKEAADESRAEKESRAVPGPEVKNYWGQVDQLRHERNKHAGYAAGLFGAGLPAEYGAIKTVPWAVKNAPLWLAGMGLEAGMIHPGLALPFIAAAALPLAVPAAAQWGAWEAAKGSSGQVEQAMNKHAEARERARIVRKIVDNYRDQPGAPAPWLTPDQAY